MPELPGVGEILHATPEHLGFGLRLPVRLPRQVPQDTIILFYTRRALYHPLGRRVILHQPSRSTYSGELCGQVHVVGDAQHQLALRPILSRVRLLGGPCLLSLGTDVQHLRHGGTDHLVFPVGTALRGTQFRLRLAVNPALVETARMHPVWDPSALQMHIKYVANSHTPRFDGPLVPKGRIFPGAPLGRVPGIIAFEMLAGGARVLVSLPRRYEQVQMRLLVRATERRGIMKGIGTGQQVPGNDLEEIAHKGHVGPVSQHVGEQNLPLLKGPAAVAFLSPRGTLRAFGLLKVPAGVPLSPGWQVARVGIHQILTPLTQIPQLPLRWGLHLREVACNVLQTPPRRPPATLIDRAHEAHMRHALPLLSCPPRVSRFEKRLTTLFCSPGQESKLPLPPSRCPTSPTRQRK